MELFLRRPVARWLNTGLTHRLAEADVALDGAVSEAASGQVAKHRLTAKAGRG
jgi:hypothetical protein